MIPHPVYIIIFFDFKIFIAATTQKNILYQSMKLYDDKKGEIKI